MSLELASTIELRDSYLEELRTLIGTRPGMLDRHYSTSTAGQGRWQQHMLGAVCRAMHSDKNQWLRMSMEVEPHHLHPKIRDSAERVAKIMRELSVLPHERIPYRMEVV